MLPSITAQISNDEVHEKLQSLFSQNFCFTRFPAVGGYKDGMQLHLNEVIETITDKRMYSKRYHVCTSRQHALKGDTNPSLHGSNRKQKILQVLFNARQCKRFCFGAVFVSQKLRIRESLMWIEVKCYTST